MDMQTVAKHSYEYTSDHGSISDVELSSLPNTIAARSSGSSDNKTRTLLEQVLNASNSTRRLNASKNSENESNAYRGTGGKRNPKNYVQLQLGADKADENKPAFAGWRTVILLAATITGLIFLINVCFIAVAGSKFPPSDGVGTMYMGDCNLVKQWDTALHSVINILATVLLAASSFTMQCIGSPTRGDVDRAHAKRIPLDIGIPSVKNLFYMQHWKRIVWFLLCLSALPLHLLWNSVIFTTSGTHLWTYVIAEESFLAGTAYEAPFNSVPANFTPCRGRIWDDTGANAMLANVYNGYQANNYVKLTAEQCFNAYNEDYFDDRRNLIMITKPNTTTKMSACGYAEQQWNGSSIVAVDFDIDGGWSYVLGDTELLKSYKEQVDSTGTWSFGSYHIEYCYSETKVSSGCQLQYASALMYVVVACNAIKLVCMAVAAHFLWDLNEPILATVGDATVEFLERPDATTKGMCLLDSESLRKGVWQLDAKQLPKHEYNPIYSRKPKTRLYHATSRRRWWSSITPCIIYLSIGFLMFGLSVQRYGYGLARALRLNFGLVDPGLMLNLKGASGIALVVDVLVANSFQLALSTTYFLYNSLYTAQCSALEWASYIGTQRKSLRVTWPKGQQRSTFYLELPYRYSLPLIAISILLHFLISQSIFLARLFYYDSLGNLSDLKFADVGFSPPAALTACCIGLGTVLAQLLHACRPLDNRIPIHGNKSATISAMCHAKVDHSVMLRKQSSDSRKAASMPYKPLSWGVTSNPDRDSDPKAPRNGVIEILEGHCTFSADVIELPQLGQRYR